MIIVNELTPQELKLIAEARQEHGNKIYGDRDEFRDGSLDMSEECLDIIDILNRRTKWLIKNNIQSKEINYLTNCIVENTLKTIADIQLYDKYIRQEGYKVDDKNGGERLGLDYLEYLREIEKANKAHNIEGV